MDDVSRICKLSLVLAAAPRGSLDECATDSQNCVENTNESLHWNTTGSLSTHTPDTSVWWPNPKVNLIELGWIYPRRRLLLIKCEGCELLKKNNTYHRYDEEKSKQTVKRVQGLTLEWLRLKMCCQKVRVKTQSDIFSRQMTHPRPWACSRKSVLPLHCLLWYSNLLP